MAPEHTISLSRTRSEGRRSGDEPLSMPVGDVVASNGLIAGQSGATPTATAVDVTEAVVDAGETALVVDPGGAFATLADDPAVLHVGGDRDCDVQVDPDAAERVATLAVGGDTTVLLDLESVDAADGDALLGSLTDALLEAGTRGGDLLLVLAECHRWLAADGPASRAAENLVQLGGRRHDVGILGVTDQPADLRSEVTGGVDWLLAHRLTWREDVAAVVDLLEGVRADDLKSLEDREAMFTAGWEGGVHRVRVDDADESGTADTPGTTEASGTTAESENDATDAGDDLLAGLAEVREPSGAEPETETTADGADDGADDVDADVAALRERIEALERDVDVLADDDELADTIADAIVEGLQTADLAVSPTETATGDHTTTDDRSPGSRDDDRASATSADTDDADDADHAGDAGGFGDVFDAFGDDGGSETPAGRGEEPADAGASPDPEPSPATDPEQSAAAEPEPSAATDPEPSPSADDATFGGASADDADDGGMSFEPIDFGFDEEQEETAATSEFGPPARHGTSGRSIPRYLRKIVRGIEEMDGTTRRMLAHYVDEGRASPMDAHYAAGGGGDRTRAYAVNRQLRTNGLIEHVGKGDYAPRLREYVVDRAGHSVPEHELDRAVEVIRQTVEAV